jgi:hypothetical protein
MRIDDGGFVSEQYATEENGEPLRVRRHSTEFVAETA